MATRYGRAGGNWSASGTWSASSGGGSDGAGLNAGDDVVLDSNSSGSFTIDTTISITSLVCTGFTGTLTHNGVTLTVSGNTFTLASGMTYSAGSSSRVVSFTSTTGTTAITSAGKSFGSVVFNGAGGTFQLQDAANVLSGGSITLTAGTFDCNNKNVTTGSFSSNNSNARTLSMGSGSWVLNATIGTVWNTTTATNMTVSANTATLGFSASATGARTCATGGLNFNGASISLVNSGALPANFSITGAGTVGAFSVTAPISLTFSSGTTFTVSSAFALAGTSASNVVSISTNDTSGTAATISVASGSPSLSWAAIQGMTFTGGATFTAANSFDLKGNTGITITGPSGGSSVIGVIGS